MLCKISQLNCQQHCVELHRAADGTERVLSGLVWSHSLESVFSGLSQHDEDKQTDLSVQGERHHFVQHNHKTLKTEEGNTGDW